MRACSPFTMIALCLALAPMAAHAASGDAPEAMAPGSWSVQFSVLPDFTLGSYSGANLSLKRHLAGGRAVRFGVSVTVNGGGEDLSNVDADTVVTNTQIASSDVNLVSIGVNGYYLWYTDRAAPIHAYWGAGPLISFARRHDERSQTQTIAFNGQPPQTAIVNDDITSRDWRVGAAANLGVEWLVARRLGLFAEYSTALTYLSSRNTRHSTTEVTNASPRSSDFEDHNHRVDFSGGGGRLGVSVYY